MDYDDIRDDENTWGDIIWSDGEYGNIPDSTVSVATAILPTPPFLSTPPCPSTPKFPATTLSHPNTLLNRRKDVGRLPRIGTPFPIFSDMLVQTPDTASLQRHMAKFTTIKPEGPILRGRVLRSLKFVIESLR